VTSCFCPCSRNSLKRVPNSRRRVADNRGVSASAELRCEIVRWISDDPQPGWVEARFTDARGRTWSVVDKSAIFTAEPIGAHSEYPRDGIIRCELVDRPPAWLGAGVVRVLTIDCNAAGGLREFDVFRNDLASG